MKIKNLIISALLGAAALFASCMPEEPIINTLEGIELGSTYITIAKGQTSASTTMKILDSWTSTVPEWLTLDPNSGAAGEFNLKFIAKADTLSEGEVNINFAGKSQKIIVIRDGDKPKKAGVIFEEPFIGHGQGDFTIKSIVGNPWSYDAKYGMKATAYINNANTDAESYLISPEIDLTEEKVALLSFEDAVNYMNGQNMAEYLSVDVTTDNGATWETVEVPTWPVGTGWDFVRSGDVDLSKFLGKKIKFAFHYKSTTAASPTWEVKNVKVANVAGAVPPELAIEPATVDLSGSGESAEVKVTTDGELEVTGPFTDAECKTADPAPWASIAASAGGYTVTAEANPGEARSAYFLFSSSNENGSTNAVLKVNQGANPGAKGAAITNPYTVAEALEICRNKTYSDSDVYVKGIINKIDNINLDYGNAQFWISDDGATADLEAYRNFWFDGAKYTSEDQLKVGDEVIICGKLTLYEKEGQDPIAEFSKNNKLVSLNGGVQYYTVAQAIAALLDGSAPVDEKVFVSGIINKIDNINLDYGNAQYWISDDGTTADFEIYRGFYLGGEKFTSEDQIAVGDAVTVLGKIKIYKKEGKPDVYEFDSNNFLYFLTHNSAPQDEWDFTPSDEYKSAANLWKPVDENHTVNWYYNPNWAGELEAPETSFKESTYTVKLNEADDAAEWTTQMKIIPGSDFLLDPQKKYTFSCKVHSTTGTNVFIKMYQNGVDWPESFETPAYPNRISIAAGETKEIKVENFIPLETPQMILIDFAHHAADNTIHVKDIVVKETGSVAPAGEWDYTPGADYLADNNLWRTVAAGSESYYYYHCIGADWNGTDTLADTVPFLTVKESTYELDYADATTQSWQNQLFIYPNESHSIALDAAKNYKLKVTIGSNNVCPAFFKISKYDAANAKHEGEVIYEAGSSKLDPSTPWVIEQDITGVSCDNIILVMDFGGNPADTKVYIKDITLLDLSAPVDNTLSISDILKQEKGAAVESKECQVVALTQRGFVASDGDKAVYVYTQGGDFNGKVGLGDKIKFAGSKTVYNGVHEIEKLSALEILSVNNTINYPAAKDVTASATSYEAGEAEFVSFTGTLAISGNYYNVVLDGIDSGTKQGSLVYPADYLGAKSFDGKHIRVEGYFNGLSGGGKYLNVIATSIDEVGAATPVSITIDGDMSDWANVEGTVREPDASNALQEVKGAADNERIYVYIKRAKIGRWKDLWGGDSGNVGYYYYDFDLDNNPETGDFAENSHGNYEAWTYLYMFGGTADAPAFREKPTGSAKGMTTDSVKCAGTVTDDFIEVEISFLRSELPTIIGDTISVSCWGNKDANPVTRATFGI